MLIVFKIFIATATDFNNCSDTACITVTVEPKCDSVFYIPNAFSPNGDLENDELKLYYENLSCIKSFKLIIYNRWGEKVFETANPLAGWDGSYNGEIENSEVFTYYLEASLSEGESIIKRGNISLLR